MTGLPGLSPEPDSVRSKRSRHFAGSEPHQGNSSSLRSLELCPLLSLEVPHQAEELEWLGADLSKDRSRSSCRLSLCESCVAFAERKTTIIYRAILSPPVLETPLCPEPTRPEFSIDDPFVRAAAAQS